MPNIHRNLCYLRTISFTLFCLMLATPAFSDTVGYFKQDDVLEPDKTRNNIVLIDVRTPAEYNTGRVPTAINIPLAELSYRLDQVITYKDKNIVVYCRSGRRARIAARIILQATDIQQVYFLMGDMNLWLANNRPLER